MTLKVHEITRYSYLFSSTTGAPLKVQLFGPNEGDIGRILFVDDAATIPSITIRPNQSGADFSMRRSFFRDVIDMLRNEAPIILLVNDLAPGFAAIGTSTTVLENVGEGE